eukprot:1158771-Pelagomonas_calceolata.AAC.1
MQGAKECDTRLPVGTLGPLCAAFPVVVREGIYSRGAAGPPSCKNFNLQKKLEFQPIFTIPGQRGGQPMMRIWRTASGATPLILLPGGNIPLLQMKTNSESKIIHMNIPVPSGCQWYSGAQYASSPPPMKNSGI